MTDLLRKVEKVLDDFNGEHGNVDDGSLCQWCRSRVYGPEEGIEHRMHCIIRELREAISEVDFA